MTFALCLQVPNHIRSKRWVELYGNFVPQMIFLQSIFGYLALCILYKWSVDWSQASISPPSLLNMLINMFLEPGHVDPASQLYPGQARVQVILLGLAGICVPWLLLVKPYYVWTEMHQVQAQGYVGLSSNDEEMTGTRDAPDGVLEGEEEGEGRAIVEEHDAEVHIYFSFCVFQAMG